MNSSHDNHPAQSTQVSAPDQNSQLHDLRSKTDRIVRPAEAVIITGRSLASIWRDEQAGKFPPKVRIGENAVGYRLSELQKWLDSCVVVNAESVKLVAPGARRGRKSRSAVSGV